MCCRSLSHLGLTLLSSDWNHFPFIVFLFFPLLEEHLRIKGRTTWYETVAEMQEDLDAYLETYNCRRPHRSCGVEARTPYEVFKVGVPTKSPARKKPARKEVKTAAQTLTSARPGVR